MISRILPDKIPAIARNRKVLVCSTIVLAAIIVGSIIWISVAGSSGYKEQTISSMFGPQTVRTKGDSAQLCSDGKWVPIEMHGGQIVIPGGTHLTIGGVSCSNSSSGTPLVAILILVIASVLEVATLGLLLMALRLRSESST